MPAFERLDEVASVNASGLIEKQLEILLNEEKIADLNSQIQADIEKQLDENREALEEAKQKLPKAGKLLSESRQAKNKLRNQCRA